MNENEDIATPLYVFNRSQQLVQELEHGSIALRFFRQIVDVHSMQSKSGWHKVVCPCSWDLEYPNRTGGFLTTKTGGLRYKCFRTNRCMFDQTVYHEPPDRLNDRAIELWLQFGGAEDAQPEIERYVKYQKDAQETYE